MKRYLPFVIVAAVALLTATGGTILYRTKQRPALTITKEKSISLGDESPHIRGNPNARVTLEEYGDFQ